MSADLSLGELPLHGHFEFSERLAKIKLQRSHRTDVERPFDNLG